MKTRAALALSGLLIASLVACGPPPSANTARKVGKEAKVDGNAPTSLADTKFEESPAGGDPKVVGCSDGQREGFANLEKFPDVAGCLGSWDGRITLRKGSSKTACGDDSELCPAPADVCAEGWHICGRNGDYKDLSERISDQECFKGAGPGKFVAGISHVKKKGECSSEPGPTTRYPCLKEGWGAEPVCCGKACRSGQCKDSVWPGKTRISVGKAEGCGGVTSERNGGIMCCKDDDKSARPRTLPTRVVPPPAEPAPTPEATAGTEAAAPTDDSKPEEAKKADDKKADAKKAD